MKRAQLYLLLLGLAVGAKAADDFWRQLTTEERAAAGVDQLAPEQRAALDKLVTRYAKEGARRAVEGVREKIKEEVQAGAREQKRATLGLPSREDETTQVLRTRILGEFRGWTGHTVFRLANEQIWQQETTEDRFFPMTIDPEVEISPSRFGGWKMTLLKEGLWVRVRRIR